MNEILKYERKDRFPGDIGYISDPDASTLCMAMAFNYYCTLASGHKGIHAAHAIDGKQVARWLTGDPEAQEPPRKVRSSLLAMSRAKKK